MVGKTIGEENNTKILDKIGIKDKPKKFELNEDVFIDYLKIVKIEEKQKFFKIKQNLN
jgi:hypothetical protein